jgi:uncharacterized membrane protein
LETLGIRREHNQHVTDEQFRTWQKGAVSSYTALAMACAVKVTLSAGLLLAFQPYPNVLRFGGMTVFVLWVAFIVMTWRRLTEFSAQRRELGIGRKAES